MKKYLNQQGVIKVAPVLAIITAVGIISFLLISSTLPTGGLFGLLNPKPLSHAAMPVMNGLHVSGNQILNSTNQKVRLLGVNYGAANPCVQNYGIFGGGAPGDITTVQAMQSWDVTAVRMPLNEDCWLGINGSPAAYSGTNYQTAIVNMVNLFTQNNIAVILDLHWSAPGTILAQNQQPMPDQDHTPAFWTSVASTFKTNSSVVFDLYNEPYPDHNNDTTAAWQCLRDGCSQSTYVDANNADISMTWQAVGMQSLVNTVRATGATNLIMVGGPGWAGLLDKWQEYKPTDPTGNLAASIHIYPNTWCSTLTCWNSQLSSVITTNPLVIGEMGDTSCNTHGFIDQVMNWADTNNQSYMGWYWWRQADTGCTDYPLLTDFSGTPSIYGQGLKNNLVRIATGKPIPTPTPTPVYGTTVLSQQVIYDDKLENGFVYNDWTNPGTTPCYITTPNTTIKVSGTNSLPLNLSQWCTTFLYNPTSFPFDIYTHLEFDVYALAPTLSTFNVTLSDTNYSTVGNALSVTNPSIGGISALGQSWQHVKIPLYQFGLSGGTPIQGIQFRDENGDTGAGNVLIDNLRLVTYNTVGNASPTPTATPSPSISPSPRPSSTPVPVGSNAPKPMPVISTNVPAFASSSSGTMTPNNANSTTYDGLNNLIWQSTVTPAWIAYDLSAIPTTNRGKVDVVWFNNTNAYDCCSIASGGVAQGLPVNYTLEANSSTGGTGSVPTSGWVILATVSNNTLHSRQQIVDLTGYNWIRMNISSVSGGATVQLMHFDVHDLSQSNGATQDSYLFLGDSITLGGTNYGEIYSGSPDPDNIPSLINAQFPQYFPAEEDGGIVGSDVVDALNHIDGWLTTFPGRYVDLSYGTNDATGGMSATTFYNNYANLVQKVINAGKIPIIPKIPWASNAVTQANVPTLNSQIDLLYQNFPQVIKGPDFYTFFFQNQNLINTGDVHPTSAGYEQMRKIWAQTLARAVYSPTPTPTPSPHPSTSPSPCQGADLNHDGKVDLLDYSILVSHFNQTVTPGTLGDINNNGVVDLLDYSILVSNFGKSGC